jgi:multiple sugar transport system substrate-binding protein
MIDHKKFDRLLLYGGIAVLVTAFFFIPRRGESPPPAPPPEDTTLVFAQWWEDALEGDTLAALVREFEEANPGIKIRLDTRPYGEIRELLLRRGEAETDDEAPLPDIAGLDPRWIGELIRADMLEPLGKFRGDDFDGGEAEFEGRAVPLVSSMDMLFYNIELLRSAGFDRPPKNQDEFLAFAKTLSDPGADRYGAVLSLAPENPQGIYRNIFPWLWMSGAPLVQDGAAQFGSPPIIGALEFLQALYAGGAISPGSFSKTEEDKLGEFIDRRAAMMIGSVLDIPRIREQGFPFGITAVPGPALYIGKPIFGLTSWYAGITRSGAHREESRRFIRFLAEQAPRLGAALHTVPTAGGGTAGDDYISGDPLYAKAFDIYEAGDSPRELYGISREAELESVLREELYRMFEQGQSPAETAASLQERWQKLLAEE